MCRVRKLRVFAASPSDVSKDRDSLKKVIQELNKGVACNKEFVLEVVTWEDVVPDTGRPEQVILDQIGDYDIFVGVMGRRFGTPTGEYEGGTEEEFYTAYNSYMTSGRPRILFYFKNERTSLPSIDELEQLTKVYRFREAIRNKVLFREYVTGRQFVDLVREHMTKVLLNWNDPPDKQVMDDSSRLKARFWPVWRDANLDGRAPYESIEGCLHRAAQNSVKFMTISGRSVYIGGIEDILDQKPKRFSVKLLLFDWNSPCFAAKMRDERRRTEDEVELAREKARSIADQFVRRSAMLQCDLQVKLHSEYPVWRLLIVDERHAYAGYYLPGKRGYEGPMFHFESSDETGLFYPVNQYFDMLWDSAGAPLQIGDPRFELLELPPCSL